MAILFSSQPNLASGISTEFRILYDLTLLSWHVQNCVVIWQPEIVLDKTNFASNWNYNERIACEIGFRIW